MSPRTKGQGYSPGDSATDTGRTAVANPGSAGPLQPWGVGRGPPQKKDIPFARHLNIHIILGTGDDSTADTDQAIDRALEEFERWKAITENQHYRIAEVRFDFVDEGKLALFIVYSK